ARATHMKGAAGIIMLAVCWAALEFLRGQFGNVFAGFPWNLLAISWTAVDPMTQSAAFIGSYGLSALTVLIAAMPAVLAEPATRREVRWIWFAAALLLLAALWLGGLARLAGANDEPVAGVRLRLVQGNIEQSLKWKEGRREETFAHYLRLTRSP